MSTNLPTKSSSRSGRFKKKLVSEAVLEFEAPVIENQMAPILDSFNQGHYTSAEFTAHYIITVLAHRFPGTWLGSRRSIPLSNTHQLTTCLSEINQYWEPNIKKRLSSYKTLGDIFNNFSFQSTPLSVNRTMVEWSNGLYRLELMFRIPRPAEVLDQQKSGRRCVTVILEKEKAGKLILGERDALGFTLHDLIHADHFYHDNQCYEGQLGFYGFLNDCLHKGHFESLLTNSSFESEFEYLISDMNAYAIHLLKCLKSAITHYHQDGENFLNQWLLKLDLNTEEASAFMKLNSPHFNPQDDKSLLTFLSKFKSI
jgi:hypothetical protein